MICFADLCLPVLGNDAAHDFYKAGQNVDSASAPDSPVSRHLQASDSPLSINFSNMIASRILLFLFTATMSAGTFASPTGSAGVVQTRQDPDTSTEVLAILTTLQGSTNSILPQLSTAWPTTVLSRWTLTSLYDRCPHRQRTGQ